jgi:hypothetical protein
MGVILENIIGREEKLGKHLPDEPRATGSVCAVLSPGTEVVSTCDAFPTCPPDGEVGLPGEVLLWCPVISIAQICGVYVAPVQPQTLVRVPDRPAVHATQQKRSRMKGGRNG